MSAIQKYPWAFNVHLLNKATNNYVLNELTNEEHLFITLYVMLCSLCSTQLCTAPTSQDLQTMFSESPLNKCTE